MARPKILYHYTSTMHLPMILESGFLKLTESNVSMDDPENAPGVVWMTDETYTTEQKMLRSIVDKTRIRFVIDATKHQNIQRADKWMRRNGAELYWIRTLEKVGGSKASTWYVSDSEIREWVRIEERVGRVWKKLI